MANFVNCCKLMSNDDEKSSFCLFSYFGDIFAPTSRHSPWNVIETYESDNATSSAEEIEIQSENAVDTRIEIEKS